MGDRAIACTRRTSAAIEKSAPRLNIGSAHARMHNPEETYQKIFRQSGREFRTTVSNGPNCFIPVMITLYGSDALELRRSCRLSGLSKTRTVIPGEDGEHRFI